MRRHPFVGKTIVVFQGKPGNPLQPSVSLDVLPSLDGKDEVADVSNFRRQRFGREPKTGPRKVRLLGVVGKELPAGPVRSC